MKSIIAAIGALALVSTAATAAPVNKYTITGYSASSAVQRGVPLDQRPSVEQDRPYSAAIAGGANVDRANSVSRGVGRGAFPGR
ncbi:hypothetical protein ACFQI3_14570 [Hansschlegelia quercus]|uniref:DUF4148 domain-containing protein n=1 Tax=Hansschlegelia quercus TaxID=2528245 RepID=A0A4V2JDH4_9HYPH|nr:hypothetical protein [Hansschlegelia quercus]TBN48584.1 hypothetical protein EYR15_13385 [Hansschlegelia quercus]